MPLATFFVLGSWSLHFVTQDKDWITDCSGFKLPQFISLVQSSLRMSSNYVCRKSEMSDLWSTTTQPMGGESHRGLSYNHRCSRSRDT